MNVGRPDVTYQGRGGFPISRFWDALTHPETYTDFQKQKGAFYDKSAAGKHHTGPAIGAAL